MLSSFRRRRRSICYVAACVACIALGYSFASLQRPDASVPSLQPHPREVAPMSVRLFVMILTAPAHLDLRNAQRQTWLQAAATLKNNQVLFRYFIAARSLDSSTRAELEKENTIYGDMVFLEASDEGLSLLTQKLLDSLAWVQDHVVAEYVLKCDDDTYVHLPQLLEELTVVQQHPNSTDAFGRSRPIYWGYFIGKARPKTEGSYPIKTHVICETLIPYAAGGGYVLSMNLVPILTFASKWWTQYSAEDASMGMWLGALNVSRIHDLRFDSEWVSRGCTNDMLLRHKMSVQDLLDIHQRLADTNKQCVAQFISRIPWYYHWRNPYSLCCPLIKQQHGAVEGGPAHYNIFPFSISPN